MAAAIDGKTVAVLGGNLMLWDTASGDVESQAVPLAGPMIGVDRRDGQWRVMDGQAHSEMYAVPCSDFPGCHGDAIREWYDTRIAAWDGSTWHDEGMRKATKDYETGVPTGSGMDDAWTGHAEIGDRVYQMVQMTGTWTNATAHGTLPDLPCQGVVDGKMTHIAALGGRLYATVPQDEYDNCPGGARHLFRFDGTRWQASQAAAPVAIGGRPMVAIGDRILFPGSPTVEYSDDDAWWDLERPAVNVTHSFDGNNVTFAMEPYTYPWGEPGTPEWSCWNSSCPTTGWTVSFPRQDAGQVHVTALDPLFSAHGQTMVDIGR